MDSLRVILFLKKVFSISILHIYPSRGRILGRNWDKSLRSFPPCYSQSHLLMDFAPPPPPFLLSICHLYSNIAFFHKKLLAFSISIRRLFLIKTPCSIIFIWLFSSQHQCLHIHFRLSVIKTLVLSLSTSRFLHINIKAFSVIIRRLSPLIIFYLAAFFLALVRTQGLAAMLVDRSRGIYNSRKW
jgi:hypothetical protein